MTSQASPLPPEETVGTSVCKKTLSLKWIVHEFKASLRIGTLRSPCFSVLLQAATAPEPSWNSVWHLVIYPYSSWLYLCQGPHMDGMYREDHEKKCAGCRRVLISNCRLFIIDHKTQETKKVINCEDDDITKICNEEARVTNCKCTILDEYLYNDTLCVQVEADLSFVAGTAYDLQPDNIREGLHSLYKNGLITDAIIECEDQEFKVHRAVLASQSPVFCAMFEVDMMERRSGVVEVSGISSAAMSDLVVYLYTGTAPNLKTLAGELLDVAEMYQISRLLTMCEYELRNKVNETSVIETLILAELHGKKGLKKACLEFIRLNPAKVFQTREWEEFKDHKGQYLSLYMDILEHFACM